MLFSRSGHLINDNCVILRSVNSIDRLNMGRVTLYWNKVPYCSLSASRPDSDDGFTNLGLGSEIEAKQIGNYTCAWKH